MPIWLIRTQTYLRDYLAETATAPANLTVNKEELKRVSADFHELQDIVNKSLNELNYGELCSGKKNLQNTNQTLKQIALDHS